MGAAVSYSKILSRASKYKLCLCIGHQHTGQIPQTLLEEIFGNVSTLIAFNVAHKDATRLSNEYVYEHAGNIEHVLPDDFLRLRQGEAIVKIERNVLPVHVPLLPSTPNRKRADYIIDRSYQNYSHKQSSWYVDIKPPDIKRLPPKKNDDDDPTTGILMNAKLTMRDIAVILDVYKYRYLTATQIMKLHFPSMPMAWRRLSILTTLHYLKAFTTPNINERIFYLDRQGAAIVAGELLVDIDSLSWERSRAPKDYFFLKHFLAINDFRILITKASQQSDISLLGFIPEYVGEQTKEGFVKKYIRDKISDLNPSAFKEYSHTPDAVFSLEKDGKSALFFLEIDRGGEIISDLKEDF